MKGIDIGFKCIPKIFGNTPLFINFWSFLSILMVFLFCRLTWLMGFVVVVKKPEMEIGLPTDVKHVTHIGSENTPSWVRLICVLCFLSLQILIHSMIFFFFKI